jgi:hypothetical protein
VRGCLAFSFSPQPRRTRSQSHRPRRQWWCGRNGQASNTLMVGGTVERGRRHARTCQGRIDSIRYTMVLGQDTVPRKTRSPRTSPPRAPAGGRRGTTTVGIVGPRGAPRVGQRCRRERRLCQTSAAMSLRRTVAAGRLQCATLGVQRCSCPSGLTAARSYQTQLNTRARWRCAARARQRLAAAAAVVVARGLRGASCTSSGSCAPTDQQGAGCGCRCSQAARPENGQGSNRSSQTGLIALLC